MDDYVTSGMVVGLGTGSTAAFAGEFHLSECLLFFVVAVVVSNGVSEKEPTRRKEEHLGHISVGISRGFRRSHVVRD